MKKLLKIISLIFLFILCTGCSALKTPSFDNYSFTKTLELKNQVSILIDLSTDSYETQEPKVKVFLEEINKLVEYEKNRKHNEITVAMWELLTQKDKQSITRYFIFWEKHKTVSPHFAKISKQQIEIMFDLLLEYELKKSNGSGTKKLQLTQK
ncbi:MAG: hypothetical protein QM535_03380 [Limnohabitans sp.]|nr:hypothetical protein [Limnohabitans sp.]